jgi:GTP-binding protein Era
VATPIKRAGCVVLFGRSNMGKSTLLNAALDQPLAIVSRQPQTTRDRLLGVVRYGDAEIGFLDTPGMHQATTRLGREMNRVANSALAEADVVVFVTAIPKNPRPPLTPQATDLKLLSQVPADKPVVLVINKVDLLKDKALLLPLMAGYGAARELAAIVPISARAEDGVELVLAELEKLLPEGEARHGEDDVTDRPLRFFASEYVREAILGATKEEVPHAVAVTIDEYVDPPDGKGTTHIAATIHVEREGQKGILIGDGGSMLKRIGIAARARIEALVERQVHLKLWVRVSERWRDKLETIADFGLPTGGKS